MSKIHSIHILKSAMITAGTLGAVAGEPTFPSFHPSTRPALEQNYRVLTGKFLDPHGVLMDYVGDLPTAEEFALGKPNALGWFTPLEDGPMYTGVFLSAVCERARRTGAAEDAALARRLAKGLIACASVSEVPGFIARGIGEDGKSHYPMGSDDQTHPWFLGLYDYWRSPLPDAGEKASIAAKVQEVADALQANRWGCPCDGSFKGQTRGAFMGAGFRDASRYLFMLAATHRITGDPVWLERYHQALEQKPGKEAKQNRLEICKEGYAEEVVPMKKAKGGIPFWAWIYVGSATSLKRLSEMDPDPGRKAAYLEGLENCVAEALPGIAEYRSFDNLDDGKFGREHWRDVFTNWFPQANAKDAERASSMRNAAVDGPRFNYEARGMGIPLASAAIVALSAKDGARRAAVESAIRHFDYDRLKLSRMVYGFCAFYNLDPRTGSPDFGVQ